MRYWHSVVLIPIITLFMLYLVTPNVYDQCYPHEEGETSVLWFTSYSKSDINAKFYYWFHVVNKTGKIRDICLNSVDLEDHTCEPYDNWVVSMFKLENRTDTPILYDCDRRAFIDWETGNIV